MRDLNYQLKQLCCNCREGSHGTQSKREHMLTHHAPSSQSVPARYARDLLTPAFASNLEMLMNGDRPALWVHGHKHESYDYEVYGTRVVCNTSRLCTRCPESGFLAGFGRGYLS